MKSIGRTHRRAVMAACAAFAAFLLLAGCGKAGKIYGVVDHEGTWIDGYVGGFPSGGYFGTYYEIEAGTYDLYWTVFDGMTYYPSPTTYWHSTYTVEADPGKLLFVDGKDHEFALLLGYTSIYKGGDVKSAQSPPTGSRTWTEDGLRITVTAPTQVTGEVAAEKGTSRFQGR